MRPCTVTVTTWALSGTKAINNVALQRARVLTVGRNCLPSGRRVDLIVISFAVTQGNRTFSQPSSSRCAPGTVSPTCDCRLPVTGEIPSLPGVALTSWRTLSICRLLTIDKSCGGSGPTFPDGRASGQPKPSPSSVPRWSSDRRPPVAGSPGTEPGGCGSAGRVLPHSPSHGPEQLSRTAQVPNGFP